MNVFWSILSVKRMKAESPIQYWSCVIPLFLAWHAALKITMVLKSSLKLTVEVCMLSECLICPIS